MPATISGGTPTDIVFIIDNTGSMWSYITKVKNSITSFANTLNEGGTSFRLGLIEYGDLADSAIRSYGFTEDPETFKKWISGIRADGGLDGPESGLEVVTEATKMEFLAGNEKRFIVVTDADFHNLGESGDGDPSSYLSTDSVLEMLGGTDVQIDVFGTVGRNCQTEWQPIANATGGSFYDINNLDIQIIAQKIISATSVNVSLGGSESDGVMVVPTVKDSTGNVGLTSDVATFKTSEATGDYVVGNVDSDKNYIAVRNSAWRQAITVPANWLAQGTYLSDTINIVGNSVTALGAQGNDIIVNESSDAVRIDGGEGNDSISNGGANALFTYADGEGHDTIYGFNATSTLRIGDGTGTYSREDDGDDVLIKVGEGSVLLLGAASLKSVNVEGEIPTPVNPRYIVGTPEDDTLENSLDYATILALPGNDQISNTGSNTTIDGDEGNDVIYNNAIEVTISGGAGDDSIGNHGGYSGANDIIDAGDGNDTIDNHVHDVTLRGGAGDDYILTGDRAIVEGNEGDDTLFADVNNGDSITMRGGAGNDSIRISEYNFGHLIEYSDGDGHDTVSGFNTNSTLSIAGNVYSSEVSGSDIVFTVGDGSITLKDAAKLSSINIIGTEEDLTNTWRLNGTTAIYGNTKKTLIVVTNVESLEGLSEPSKKKVVTVSAASLGLDDVSISDGYTLALGDDVKAPTSKKKWTLKENTASYKQTISAGYELEDNVIVYSPKSTKNLATVTGVTSLEGLSLKGKVVTVGADSLGTDDVTISGKGYTLALDGDVDEATVKYSWKLSGNTASYRQTTSAGYTLEDNAISYTPKATKTLAKVAGVTSTDGLTVKDNVVTVGAKSLGTSDVTISGDGYSLALDGDIDPSSTTKDWSLSGSTATYKQTTSAGYELEDNAISYIPEATKNLVKVKGVTSTDGLNVKGKVVTVGAKSLGTSDVTITGKTYTLALAEDVDEPTVEPAGWTLEDTTATYSSGAISAGYTLEDNTITYTEAQDAADPIILKGVKSIKGLKVNDTVVTVSKAALGTSKVTVNKGYTLALASNVPEPTAEDGDWSLDGSTATYTGGTTSAGYSISTNGRAITYSKATEGSPLATIEGAKATKGLTVGETAITAKASALTKDIAVGSDEYAFEFGTDYKAAKISGGGKADTITAVGRKITLEGGKGADLLTGSGGTGVFIYTEGDGNDTIQNYKAGDKLQIASDAVDIATKGNDVILTVGTGKKQGTITLKDAKDAVVSYEDSAGEHTYPEVVTFNAKGTAVTLTAAYTAETFDVADYPDYANTIVTINAAAVEQDLTITANKKNNKVLGGEGNDVIYGGKGNDSLVGGAGTDAIYGEAGDDTIEGGTGNDTLTGGAGSDTFVYNKGDGNDKITDFDEDDTLNIVSDSVKKIAPSKSGKDLILTLASKGKITLSGAAEKVIAYSDSKGEHSYPEVVRFNDEGTGATILSGYTKDSFDIADYDEYKDSVETIDASEVTQGLSITANKKNNVIIGGISGDKLYGLAGDDSINGGGGNDSLWGGAGSDTLTGGSGRDTFFYTDGDGDDFITDYDVDLDTVIVNTTDKVGNPFVRSNSVIFEIGDGRLTFENAASSYVDIKDASGNVLKTYSPR
ncbi:MAG: VWA domain-containing protein [Selenomonadaceae bacterium]|nr:VWA domain-containing protein [Selenomonadaceae bacterium]